MKKVVLLVLILLAASACLFTSCDKDDEDLQLSQEIKNIVPDAILTTITDLGMPINKGQNPPNLVNFYKMSPFTLKASNRSSDIIGDVYSDYTFHLYSQDNSKLTISLDYVNGPETGTGMGSFLSGDGNNFSVFTKVLVTHKGYTADVIMVLSGTITSQGISNLYYANFMLDNRGVTANVWIENGQGRVFYDSDGNSPIVSSLQSATFKNILAATCGAGVLIK